MANDFDAKLADIKDDVSHSNQRGGVRDARDAAELVRILRVWLGPQNR